jgi:predicted ATPase/class 3 adenylate cyclase/ribosomal protein L40E
MRCLDCQTLNPPDARFCMECGNHLLVCALCQAVNPPQAKFCIQCGVPLGDRDQHRTSPLPALGIQAGEPAGAPYPQVEQLSAPQERRVVTVMFADIIGSTPLADRLDPEDLRAILAGYFNLMAEQIRRHGGTVEKYIGDAVMAVFGSPLAHEDDPARAIRAALDMQHALTSFNTMRLANAPEAMRLQMRIGINTGEVAAIGMHADRQDFLITGDAVNVAARLQQVATPDTILVGERTYLATREVFAFRSLAPLQVRGKARPLSARVVQGLSARTLALSGHPRGIEGLQAPLVGRSLEMTLMHATYARVRDARHSHLITLLGAPGVGKTRLVREFIERELAAARCTTGDEVPGEPCVLEGHCPPYGEGITYWPLVEILRTLIGVSGEESDQELEERLLNFVRTALRRARRSEDVDQVAGVLLQGSGRGLHNDRSQGTRRELGRSTLNKDAEKGGPQAALQRACRILFEAIASQQPMILVIDDLQWADEALLGLLEYLAGRLTDCPLLFLCLARPDFLERRCEWGGGQPNFTTIILDALSRQETSELITELLSTHELPDVLLHTIVRRAEGNPFFVEEIVRMLIDQQVLSREDGAWRISAQSEETLSDLASPATPPEDTLINAHYLLPLRVPDTIQGVLAARIDLLGPIEKQVVQAASIIGRTFWLSAVQELVDGLEREEVSRTLEHLLRRDFLEESEKRAGGSLEHEESFSFKHILIRDVIYDNIARVRRSHKHAQLALWLEQRVAERREDVVELLAYHYRQALAHWSATRYAHAVVAEESDVGHAQETLADPPVRLTRPELVERTLQYLTLAGDKAYHNYHTISAIQSYSEALDLLQANEAGPLTRARMHQKLGHAYTQRANADEAWREYLQALKLMQGQAEVERGELLGLYMHIAELSTRWPGWFSDWLDMQEVRTHIDAGLALVEGQPPSGEQSSFFTYQALWYIRQMKYVAAEQRARLANQALHSGLTALRIAEEVNDTGAQWIALDALGSIYRRQQKYSEAHAIQHRRQTLQALIHGREEMYDLYLALGWTHERLSAYPAAALWCGRAWHIAQRMESPSMLLSSMHRRLVVWYQWERWGEARLTATRMLQTSEQYQQEESWQLFPLEILAELAYRTGEVEESERFLRQYRRVFEQHTNRPLLLPGLYAARGEWAQALREQRTLVHQAEPFPAPSLLAHLAELTVLAGEPLAAQEAVCERAISQAEQAGARKFLAVALRARGRLSGGQQLWDAAEEDLRRAQETFKALDLPWEQGQTLYCLGCLQQLQATLLLDEGSPLRASKQGLARLFFEQAQGFFESLHAVHAVQQVRKALQESERAGE